ncbi:MAG: PH domain-containing protein [Nanoarchaeota archaeon]|nr:PH domain-containing protein [Nanoarchaeota archaeon]MBU1030993.1 PH domain-containing protein [Nanoarchaeota archaeon]MBU1849904.1 PH domain-containing protein [Nanoarchaeota archaeon]
MEDIYPKEEKVTEQCQIIKPEIKYFLLFLNTLIPVFIFFVVFGFGLATILIGLFGWGGLIVVLVLFLLLLIGGMSLQSLSLNRTMYKFYANRVEYFEGFLVKNRKTVNYDRITNIGQRKGIIEGWFGLGTVFIDTAGSSAKGHELMMKYLKDSDRVYDWISKVTGNYKQ